ncbi:hypothetical protein RhiJN_28535 [Ceratobasidium sp. AG-Ba]|nr:hypothetical protein RhiJN_28535 [Ceratobasidium sp. AG-Ba]
MFLSPGFTGFRSTSQVYLFLEYLNSAKSTNPSWKPADAQSLLEALVNPPNGLLRLAECMRWPSEPGAIENWSFIQGTLPVLQYMSSDWVVKSIIKHNVNALYGILHNNFKHVQSTLETFIPQMIARRAFREVGVAGEVSGLDVFTSIFVIFVQYTQCYKDALQVNLGMRELAEKLAGWFYEWESSLESPTTPFDDSCRNLTPSMRRFKLAELRKRAESLLSVVNHTQVVVTRQIAPQIMEASRGKAAFRREALLAGLHREYQGPGELRSSGPLHDNDKISIQDIRIPPTQDELLCQLTPYLPSSIPGAPHQYPATSVQRLLDIQFRLLREELVAPIRSAVQLVSRDLAEPRHAKTRLSEILQKRGGLYRGSGQDSVMFSLFTNVELDTFAADRQGCSVGLIMDSPSRKSSSKKRLMNGGLVALLSKAGSNGIEVFLGTISSNDDELERFTRASERGRIQVSFFDPEIELRIARQVHENHGPQTDRTYFLLEAPLLYESVRPFLLGLQTQSEDFAFADYLRHHIDTEYLSNSPAVPPLYAQQPGFSFQLKSLLRPCAAIGSLQLDATNPSSIARVRRELQESSHLDKSQAEAVVDTLTREISLIQGPPGTGKSYTGVQIINILVQNGVTPIVLMALTNHALDHMLESVLDKVTQNIVRIGSRSANERVSKHLLKDMARNSREHKSAIGSKFKAMKEAERAMEDVLAAMLEERVAAPEMSEVIIADCPGYYESLLAPPRWIDALYAQSTMQSGWELSGGGRPMAGKLEYWHNGMDIRWLTPPKAKVKERKNLVNRNRYAIDDDEGNTSEEGT